ncbi:MAG: hypothetical protein AAB353_05820 [Candidatus Hydrogenedentota bacterium]
MKKGSKDIKDELRAEYSRSDFPGPFVRGKYARRIKESSNVVVLRPRVAKAFPNEDAVNDALESLLELAQKATAPPVRPRKKASAR